MSECVCVCVCLYVCNTFITVVNAPGDISTLLISALSLSR